MEILVFVILFVLFLIWSHLREQTRALREIVKNTKS